MIFTVIVLLALLSRDANAQTRMPENYPTVQSALYGGVYVRSVPSEDFGTKGKTQVFRVKSSADTLVDEYPVYMRGDLFLGWSPIVGKYGLVHVEPAVVSSDTDFANMGKVTRLAFYLGGKELFSYSNEDLKKMGLETRVAHLEHAFPGRFIVHGIEQVPNTNNYVFVIEKAAGLRSTERILIDIITGKPFVR